MTREELINLRDKFKDKEAPASQRKVHAPSQGAKTPGEYFGFMQAFDLILTYIDLKEQKKYDELIEQAILNIKN